MTMNLVAERRQTIGVLSARRHLVATEFVEVYQTLSNAFGQITTAGVIARDSKGQTFIFILLFLGSFKAVCDELQKLAR